MYRGVLLSPFVFSPRGANVYSPPARQKPPSLIPPYLAGGDMFGRGVQGDFGNFARVGVIGKCLLISCDTIYSRATYKYLKAPEGRHVGRHLSQSPITRRGEREKGRVH